MTNITSEGEPTSTESMNIKRLIKDCEQLYLYAHKFDNLHETDQFLEKYNLPKLTQGKIDNRPTSIKETELTVNNFLKQKAPDSGGFTNEFNQTLKEGTTSILHNVFQKPAA